MQVVLRLRIPDVPGSIGRLMEAVSAVGCDVLDMELRHEEEPDDGPA